MPCRASGMCLGFWLAALAGWAVAAQCDPPGADHLRVASVSMVPVKWDKATNADSVERLVRRAAEKGAQLVVTPEGVLEGYVVNEVIREKDAEQKARLTRRFWQLAEPLDGPYVKRFQKLADELDLYLVLGLLERSGEKTYNSALLLGPDGGVVGKYRKSHFAQGYNVNPPGYTPGDCYPVFDLVRTRVGMMICFDRQLPEPARALAVAGANVIICPAYGGWGEWNTRLMQVRAYENQVYVVFTHPHESLFIAPDGKILAQQSQKNRTAGEQDAAILIQDIDLSRQTRSSNVISNRRPDTYQSLSEKESLGPNPRKGRSIRPGKSRRSENSPHFD